MATAPDTSAHATLTSGRGTRFHLSLNVRDLDRAVEFYRLFFGVEPAKCRTDYAKFELADPPLVMSLEPCQTAPGGSLNHLGFRVDDSALLVEVQRRLELGGIATVREEGVECCYARQTKFWVHDPDGHMWEVYTLDEDLSHRGEGHLPVIERADDGPAEALWQHRLGQPFPARVPILDNTVDRVVLQGTFNERLSPEETSRRLRELIRMLKPGGRVQLHLLTADRPLGDAPLKLPGHAAAVEHVPVDAELLAAFADAGYANPRYTLRAASPCFRIGPAELRETRIEASKPA